MGITDSFSFGRRKLTKEKREKYDEPKCNFCGKEATKSIVKTNGQIALSCFDCIPDYCDFPWIQSIEKI